MDETKELLHAILKNLELTNAKVTATQDELLHFHNEMNQFQNEMNQFQNEMNQFQADTAANFQAVREEIDDFKAETRSEFKDIKAELRRCRRNEIGMEYQLNEIIERVEKLEAQANQKHQ